MWLKIMESYSAERFLSGTTEVAVLAVEITFFWCIHFVALVFKFGVITRPLCCEYFLLYSMGKWYPNGYSEKGTALKAKLVYIS